MFGAGANAPIAAAAAAAASADAASAGGGGRCGADAGIIPNAGLGIEAAAETAGC